MTVELTSSQPRPKRRKLPHRNIVDYEYIAPTKNTNLDQNLASLPSARLRSVLSEVWGGGTTNILQVHQPIVIHHQHVKSTPTQSRTGTKSLLDKLKEHEKEAELDLSQLVIIPPSKGMKKHGGVLHPNTTEKEETSIYNQHTTSSPRLSTEILSEPMEHDDINGQDGRTTPSPHVLSEDETIPNGYHSVKTMHRFTNERDGVLLSEGKTSASSLTLERMDQPRKGIDSPITIDDEDEIYITAEEEGEEEEGMYLVNKDNKSRQQDSGDKTDNVYKEIPSNQMHLTDHILNKWKNKKQKEQHGVLNMLKKSTALDWIEDGHDEDPRKRNVGKIRKQQLQKKLNQPFLERKSISVSTWSTLSNSGDVNRL